MKVRFLGIWTAILWAQDQQLTQVDIESDCKVAVDCINSSEVDVSDFGSIVKDCRQALVHLSKYKVNFVKRQVNIVVHTLIRVAIFLASSRVFDYISHYIADANAIEMK